MWCFMRSELQAYNLTLSLLLAARRKDMTQLTPGEYMISWAAWHLGCWAGDEQLGW